LRQTDGERFLDDRAHVEIAKDYDGLSFVFEIVKT